jgi:thiol-disulfide isomerase/thioredoxin
MRRFLLAAFALLAMFGAASAFSGFAPYDKAKFDRLVQSGAPVIAHVHANWCSTCRRQEALMNDMLKDARFARVQTIRVDYDTDKDFQKAHNVNSRATILVFKDGKEVARVVFDTDSERIKRAIERAL